MPTIAAVSPSIGSAFASVVSDPLSIDSVVEAIERTSDLIEAESVVIETAVPPIVSEPLAIESEADSIASSRE